MFYMPLVLHVLCNMPVDIVTARVNKKAVIVFISFYFCNKSHFVFTELK